MRPRAISTGYMRKLDKVDVFGSAVGGKGKKRRPEQQTNFDTMASTSTKSAAVSPSRTCVDHDPDQGLALPTSSSGIAPSTSSSSSTPVSVSRSKELGTGTSGKKGTAAISANLPTKVTDYKSNALSPPSAKLKRSKLSSNISPNLRKTPQASRSPKATRKANSHKRKKKIGGRHLRLKSSPKLRTAISAHEIGNDMSQNELRDLFKKKWDTLITVWRVLDRDSDGLVGINEWKIGLQQSDLGWLSDEAQVKLFRKADQDRNGKVTFKEFKAGFTSWLNGDDLDLSSPLTRSSEGKIDNTQEASPNPHCPIKVENESQTAIGGPVVPQNILDDIKREMEEIITQKAELARVSNEKENLANDLRAQLEEAQKRLQDERGTCVALRKLSTNQESIIKKILAKNVQQENLLKSLLTDMTKLGERIKEERKLFDSEKRQDKSLLDKKMKEIRVLSNSLQSCKEALTDANGLLQNSNKLVKDAKARVRELEGKLRTTSKEATSGREKLNAAIQICKETMMEESGKHNQEVSQLRQQLLHAQDKASTLEDELERANEIHAASLKSVRKAGDSEAASIKDKHKVVIEDMKRCHDKLVQELEERITKSKLDLRLLKSSGSKEEASLIQENGVREKTVEDLKASLEQERSKILALNSELHTKKKEVAELQKACDRRIKNEGDLTAQNLRFKHDLMRSENFIETLEAKLSDQRLKMNGMESALATKEQELIDIKFSHQQLVAGSANGSSEADETKSTKLRRLASDLSDAKTRISATVSRLDLKTKQVDELKLELQRLRAAFGSRDRRSRELEMENERVRKSLKIFEEKHSKHIASLEPQHTTTRNSKPMPPAVGRGLGKRSNVSASSSRGSRFPYYFIACVAFAAGTVGYLLRTKRFKRRTRHFVVLT